MKLSDPKTQQHLQSAVKICVFGPPKGGKTQLTAELAEKFNLTWLDLEGGAETLLKLPDEWLERIDLVNIPDSRDYPIAQETVRKILVGKPVNVCDIHGKVDCIACKKAEAAFTGVHLNEHILDPNHCLVIDSGTQLSNSVISRILNHNNKDVKNEDAMQVKPEWDDYAAQGVYLDRILSAIQAARYNVVFITHEGEVELEDKSIKIVPLAGTRKFSRNVAKYFSHVVYVQKKNNVHIAASATDYAQKILTGSRTDIVIEGMQVQSLLPFFDKDTKEHAAYKTPAQRLLEKAVAASQTPAKPGNKLALSKLAKFK